MLSAVLKKPPPWIVGILNITPNSFSDGGQYLTPELATNKALQMIDEGADIIDIGGESTGPGASTISSSEEISRINKVVSELSKNCVVSIDTYKSETAKICLDLGAKIINDVSSLRADHELAKVVKEYQAYLILMFNKDGPLPHATNKVKDYKNVISEISEFLTERISHATSNGIKKENLILDSGMGKFVSHSEKYSFEVLKNFNKLTNNFSDFPFLIGTSRKGFLGGNLDERDPPSQYAAMKAVESGAKLIRTHNVKMCREFLDIRNKINNLQKLEK